MCHWISLRENRAVKGAYDDNPQQRQALGVIMEICKWRIPHDGIEKGQASVITRDTPFYVQQRLVLIFYFSQTDHDH